MTFGFWGWIIKHPLPQLYFRLPVSDLMKSVQFLRRWNTRTLRIQVRGKWCVSLKNTIVPRLSSILWGEAAAAAVGGITQLIRRCCFIKSHETRSQALSSTRPGAAVGSSMDCSRNQKWLKLWGWKLSNGLCEPKLFDRRVRSSESRFIHVDEFD